MIREIRLVNCLLCDDVPKLCWHGIPERFVYKVACTGVGCKQETSLTTMPSMLRNPGHEKAVNIVSMSWNMLNQ